MVSRKTKLILAKFFSLFSVVRGYNIFVIVFAQYLASIFILAPQKRALDVVLDWQLFLIIFSSSLAIAAGYIINNFYDAEKDLINRPYKSNLDKLVSQATKLRVYFCLNFLAVILASLVSIHAALFFSAYIFILWFYSHKLKKYPIVGNLTASFLVVLPFFGILMYFKYFYHTIFVHAFFLYLLVLIREMIKDLENIKGDLANSYNTIPVTYGETTTKVIVGVLVLLCLLPARYLITEHHVGYMSYYFYFAITVLVLFQILLFGSKTTYQYHRLHVVLKLLILLGVFSIMLINPEVVINGKELFEAF